MRKGQTLEIAMAERLQRVEESRKQRLLKKQERLRKQAHRASTLSLVANQLRVREISDKQRHAITLMVDFSTVWTYRQIAEKVGCTVGTIRNWKNDPFFLKELDKEITKRKTFPRLKAFRQFFKRVQRGDLRALNMYFKMTGDIKEVIATEGANNTGMPDVDLDQEIQTLSDELGIEVVGPRRLPVSSTATVRAASREEKEKGSSRSVVLRQVRP